MRGRLHCLSKTFARGSQDLRKSSQDFRKSKQALLLAKHLQRLAKHLPNTCETLAKYLPNSTTLHTTTSTTLCGYAAGGFYYGVTFQCASSQLLPLLIFTSNGTDSCMAPDMCSRTRFERVSNSSGQVSKMSSSWTCRIILLRIFRSFIA